MSRNGARTVIKDPVLGEVVVSSPDAWVVDLIDTREMQRLRNIMQLGAAHMVFPGATHTRFLHSLGTFEIARRMIANFPANSYTENERRIALAAALLHDLGHGPSSHSFEFYTGSNHESYTMAIIESPDTEVHKALLKNALSPDEIVAVLKGRSAKKWMSQLVTSQLDADRLDYMMRDSYFTGTIYGLVDREYIISNVSLVEDTLAFNAKAVMTIENYLLNRYHMYAQIYHNKASFAWETLIKKIMERASFVYASYRFVDKNRVLEHFLPWLAKKNWTVSEYCQVNDAVFQQFLSGMEYETDEVLSKLGYMFNRRINFKAIDWEPSKESRFSDYFGKQPNGDFFYSSKRSYAAHIYNVKRGKEIYIIQRDGRLANMSRVSHMLKTMNLEPHNRQLIIFDRILAPDSLLTG